MMSVKKKMEQEDNHESMEKNEPEQINQIKLIEKLEKVLLMNSEGKKNEIR